ncbi:MAG: serine protein kinase RIO [Candidatus Thorarchaeota archaeon]|nr:serine protein kinase RIO [Candidatus Thorarchaeota archaeon]
MKRIETKRRLIESDIERRGMKRRHDDDEFKVVEGVIDPPTLKVLYRLLGRGTLRRIHGVVSAGKESNIYRGEDAEGNAVAIKIYRVVTAQSNYMSEYILGDPRFRHVSRRNRQLIPLWAMKEYKNLQRYSAAGVRVPRPLDIQRNVLVMEFIGDSSSGNAAPLLRDTRLESPAEVFDEIISMVEIGYREAGLVHADLSEYNILWSNGPVFIDVSQSVLRTHEHARQFLLRDIQNVIAYFKKLGVETDNPQLIVDSIVNSGELTDDAH